MFKLAARVRNGSINLSNHLSSYNASQRNLASLVKPSCHIRPIPQRAFARHAGHRRGEALSAFAFCEQGNRCFREIRSLCNIRQIDQIVGFESRRRKVESVNVAEGPRPRRGRQKSRSTPTRPIVRSSRPRYQGDLEGSDARLSTSGRSRTSPLVVRRVGPFLSSNAERWERATQSVQVTLSYLRTVWRQSRSWSHTELGSSRPKTTEESLRGLAFDPGCGWPSRRVGCPAGIGAI
jgi:hypothetical protein